MWPHSCAWYRPFLTPYPALVMAGNACSTSQPYSLLAFQQHRRVMTSLFPRHHLRRESTKKNAPSVLSALGCFAEKPSSNIGAQTCSLCSLKGMSKCASAAFGAWRLEREIATACLSNARIPIPGRKRFLRSFIQVLFGS